MEGFGKMCNRLTMFVACLSMLLGVAGSTLAADDWPEFRGPTGQGLSTARDVPIEWSATKNVVWKQEIPGTGWSSPAIVDGRVYITAAIPVEGGKEGDLALSTLCFEASTGKPLWTTKVFDQDGSKAPGIHSKNSHASPTPLVDKGQIIVHFGHQGIACLNTDGTIAWKNNKFEYPPVHGNGGSPVLVEGKLVFSCDGASDPFLAAVDRRTGDLAWKTPREGGSVKKFAFSTPLVIDVNGRKQVISPGAGSVGGFDPKTGKEIWRVNYDGYSVIPRPVYGHGLLIISTGYDSPVVMAIKPDGEGDVTETHVVWKLTKSAPNTPSLLLIGDELYMISDRGIASCVDAKSGDVHWQQRIGGAYSASPVYADGRIYLQDEDGECTVIAADKKFKKLAENAINERTLASYAVTNGSLFVRGDKHLYRIGEATVSAPAAGQ
jgi:outer membrane protein assembly factor BamB